MSDHTRIEELYVARSLGQLEARDAQELARATEAHGSDCPECRLLDQEYQEVAGRLAFALAPDEVPHGMEDRILASDRRSEGRPSRPRSFRRVATALAAALLLGAGGLGGYLLAPRPVPGLTEAAAYLSEPGVRVTSLEGAGRGNLVMAFHAGRRDSYLIGSELEPAPEGKVYELWLIDGDEARPAAVFTPTGEVLVVRVRSDVSSAVQAAVTLERAPGAPQPTADPIFAGPITQS